MPKFTFVSTNHLMAALELDGATLSEAEHTRLYATLVAATHQAELLSGRFLMPRSLRIPHALTRTSTSPAFGTGTGIDSIRSGPGADSRTAARIICMEGAYSSIASCALALSFGPPASLPLRR